MPPFPVEDKPAFRRTSPPEPLPVLPTDKYKVPAHPDDVVPTAIVTFPDAALAAPEINWIDPEFPVT